METVIEFRGVSKSFDSLEVIKNLSFEVKKGDIVGILGSSGVGKSTLLKLISKLEKPTEGEIIDHSQRVAYVFQEPRLIPWKSSLENVTLPLTVNGMKKNEAKEKALYFLEKIGLNGFENYYPAQLSGGMLQRISLARAFALSPDLLLLDEPFSALDYGLKSVMTTMLKELLEENPISVLYVSHQPEEIVQFANRIFMLFSAGVIEELPVSQDEEFASFLKDAFTIAL